MRDEQYVRPPLVPREAPSAWFATWRYRVVALILLLITLLAFAWLFLRISGVTGGENPGLVGAQPRGTFSTARVPFG